MTGLTDTNIGKVLNGQQLDDCMKSSTFVMHTHLQRIVNTDHVTTILMTYMTQLIIMSF